MRDFSGFPGLAELGLQSVGLADFRQGGSQCSPGFVGLCFVGSGFEL